MIAKYPITDVDTGLLLANFDEPPGSKILEVGAHDESVADILAQSGYEVTGVDLREYGPQDLPGFRAVAKPTYEHFRADFCDMPTSFIAKWLGQFDAVVALSAIEHFGLGTYGEGKPHSYYDVIAMRLIWRLLRDGGKAYVSVPFGKDFVTCGSHWRVYSTETLNSRIIQDFEVDNHLFVVAGPGVVIEGEEIGLGPISVEKASKYANAACPHITAFFKFCKVPINRKVPDWR